MWASSITEDWTKLGEVPVLYNQLYTLTQDNPSDQKQRSPSIQEKSNTPQDRKQSSSIISSVIDTFNSLTVTEQNNEAKQNNNFSSIFGAQANAVNNAGQGQQGRVRFQSSATEEKEKRERYVAIELQYPEQIRQLMGYVISYLVLFVVCV